jgi:hypothetical protein
MLISKAKLCANAATKFGLATTVAALWMAAIPFASAAATGYPISAARADCCLRLKAAAFHASTSGSSSTSQLGS